MDPKKSGPQISYTLVPSFLKCLRARIRLAFSQEKTKPLTITPASTAMARSKITVNADTSIKTKTSVFGILFSILKLLQAKVPITTINITPTRAAMGTCSISPEAKRKNSAASRRQQYLINDLFPPILY